jgi:hypothetical protein
LPLFFRIRGVSLNRFCGNLALASATVLILLVAAETVSRITYDPENLGSVICFDPVLGWSLRPNVSYRSVDHQTGLDYLIKTNSLGLRDREFPRDELAGRRRILLIGDSVTFGTGVDADWRFSDFMQRALGDDVTVINAGVPGWGNDQELLYYETTACKFKPDIVVLTFTMVNDVVNNALAHLFLGTASKPRFGVDSGSLRLVDAVKNPERVGTPLWKTVGRHSRFLLYVKRRLDRRVYVRHAHIAGEMGGAVRVGRHFPEGFRAETAGDLTHWSVFESPPSDVIEDAWSVTEAIIARFARDCREHGAKLVVFALPPRIEVDTPWREDLLSQADLNASSFDFYAPFGRLASCCRRNGIPFVYPIEEYPRDLDSRSLYHSSDSHPSRYGHALAARVLLEYLDDNLNMHFTVSVSDRDYFTMQ